MARSLTSMVGPFLRATILRISPITAGATCLGAVLWVRLMPVITDRTPASLVGESNPACWWVTEMAARRQPVVEGLKVSARSVAYRVTVSGSAGSEARACSAVHAVKCRQSDS